MRHGHCEQSTPRYAMQSAMRNKMLEILTILEEKAEEAGSYYFEITSNLIL